jgi:hypothetical protein
MTRTLLPGASYVDAGRDWYVALIERHHFETHQGRIPLPPGEPRGLWFVRGSNVGGFRFAGKGADSSLSWEWRDGQWGRFSSATGSGCYDQRGNFRDTAPAGYQYCADDGSLVSRIETYPVRDGVNNWTERDGIRIGQGNPGGGIRVFADGVLRELEPGSCWFPNFNREGEHVTVSFWKPQEHCAVIIQTTLAELRALPPVTLPGTPIPVPVPPPPPEPPAMDYLQIIRDIRRDYPTPLGLRHWEFLVEVAQATRTQLFRKEDSNSVRIPALNKRVSLDIIGRGSLGNQWADILMDSEGRAEPAFQLHQGAAGEYVDVSQVELPGEPPPAPPPPPTPPTDEDVLRAIVRAAVSDLRNVVALLDRAVNE